MFIKELRVFSKMQRSSKHINILFHYKLESCEMTRLQTSEIMRIMINVELCGIYISIFCIDFHYDSLFWINQSASQQCAPPQNLAEISQLHEWTSWNLHLAHSTYLCLGLLSSICSSFIRQKAQVWNHSFQRRTKIGRRPIFVQVGL